MATTMLGPSKRISLAPKRRSQIVPFNDTDDTGPEIWTPVFLPGHKGYVPVLTMISGWRGKGKTLTMTMLGLIQRERYRTAGMRSWKLMANYVVDGADVVDPNIVDRLIHMDPDMRNATILVDELPSLFSNRRSLSGSNRDFGVFIQQIRKRNIEMIFTAQIPMLVDRQIREQIDWYVLPEVFGPKRQYLRLYWFDFNGQFMGQGHKYWPPKIWDADIVKVYGPLASIYGKYRSDQVVAAYWSAFKDDINNQTDWDQSLLYDAQAAPVVALPQPVEPQPERPAPLAPANNVVELIDRQPDQVDVKEFWEEAQQFLPTGSTYKKLKEVMRLRGYKVADTGYVAIRMQKP